MVLQASKEYNAAQDLSLSLPASKYACAFTSFYSLVRGVVSESENARSQDASEPWDEKRDTGVIFVEKRHPKNAFDVMIASSKLF